MPAPSLTYTITNGTPNDASQVMQNYNDLLNGITDGSKDLSIAGLTTAGNVVLGSVVSNDVTFTGSLASSIPIKTTNTYDVGTSTIGLRALYFGANSKTVAIKGSASMSADWSLTLPVTAGTSGYFLKTDGAGVSSWAETFDFTTDQTAAGTKTFSGVIALSSATAGQLKFTSSSNAVVNINSGINFAIDADNNETDRSFRISHNATDGTGQVIFSVDESGVASLGYAGSNSVFHAPGSLIFGIDSDNDQTDRSFQIQKNSATGAGTNLFTITEDSIVTIGNGGSNALLNAPGSIVMNIDSDNDQTDRSFQLQKNSATGAGTLLFQVEESGTAYLSTYSNGSLSITGGNGTITSSSDSRLKTEVDQPLPGLDEVIRLQPRFFKWKQEVEDKADLAEVHLGFYAQEVGEVIPEALGKPDQEGGYFGLYDRPILAALVQACKDLDADIRDLYQKLSL